MSLISFVIPCYRSENTIENVVNGICSLMNNHKDDSFEIILVNDCSPDNTFNVIEQLVNIHPEITGIDMAKNLGQHSALMAGMRFSKGDFVVCLDDDGQTPPEEAYKLIDGLKKWDVVYANYPEKQHSGFRNFGSNVNGKMLEIMCNKPADLYVSSYFAARRFIVDKICEYVGPFPYVMGLVLRSTNSIGSVDVNHKERESGNSGYTIKKLLALWINGLTAFSVKPLRIATALGCFSAILGVFYGIWAVINKITNPQAPLGWTTIVIILLVLGGLILFVLGMIGEYIGRMYISMNSSPQYIVRQVVRKEK